MQGHRAESSSPGELDGAVKIEMVPLKIKMIGLRLYYCRDGIWCPMRYSAPIRPVIFFNLFEE